MENTNTEANAVAELAKPVEHLGRGDLVAINENYKVSDLEQFQNGRNRARGVLKTPSFEDFKSYVLDHQEEGPHCPIFVDHKNVSATAILNYFQEVFDQGHCDHKALLQLEPTVAWTKLQNLKDRKLSQRDFAVFLEDWVSVLEIFDADGGLIGGAEALNAVRTMQIKSSTEVNSVVGNTHERRGKLDQVDAQSSEAKTPAYFHIHDSAYVGLEPRLFILRLIINTNDDKPVFALQIVKEELLLDEIIQDFKQKVIDLLPENPVRIGTFLA